MSTYLLLRNNKESGPHTMEELRTLVLKPYDLVWVEGKSAAWRYPGEINELKSFAPEVVEQPYDRFFKKPSESQSAAATDLPFVNLPDHKAYVPPVTEPARLKPGRSVYINMPAGIKNNIESKIIADPAPAFSETLTNLSEYTYASPLASYKNTNRKKTFTIPLLIAGVILLFGTGIFTGYFLSNRGISSSLIQVKKSVPVSPTSVHTTTLPQDQRGKSIQINSDPVPTTASAIETVKPESLSRGAKNKKVKASAPVKKPDSLVQDNVAVATPKEVVVSKPVTAQLPDNLEEYVTVKAGKYSVGTFGGISGVQLSVNNEAAVALDLVVVEVQYIQSNKKVFKTENVYFHNVAAGSTLGLEAPNSSRGVKIKYRISMVNARQLNYSFTDQ